MFGDSVRTHRRRLALTQDDLAIKSGVSVRTIRAIEAGRIGRPRADTVRALADALGLGAGLRDTSGPEAAGAPAGVAPPEGWPTPAQLPPDVTGFAGRREHLDRLTGLLGEGGPRPTAVVISAIAGTAGVGKTALAVHWAHQVADRFPDGQLFVNLRGFDPGGSVTSPAEAVRLFLDAMGVAPELIPPGLDAQVGLYRSLLAGKRVLVVLDNARDADHVRPLLAGSPGSLFLVTSRNQLSGLVAAEGAWPLTLDVLSDGEARQLLAGRLGEARVAAEAAATDAVIAACARLPLALAIAAAQAQRTGFSVGTVAAGLADLDHRLDALDTGDRSSQVRAVLSLSYRALTPATARLFRLLGLHPGPDVSVAAAASLAGQPPAAARRLLAELVKGTLLMENRPGRYTFHDLLRAYAIELGHGLDSDVERDAALVRVLDHYVHTALGADALLNPMREPIALPVTEPVAGRLVEPLAGPEEARRWFAAEHAVLLAVLAHAGASGRDSHTWHLGWALNTFLDRQGHWTDLAVSWQTSLEAARRLADPAVLAYTHRVLANAHARLEQLDDARRHAECALDLYAQVGDRVGQGKIHRNLGYLHQRQGDLRGALHHAEQALAHVQAAGNRDDVGNALNSVGWYHARLGDPAQALVYCEQAVTVLQDVGDRYGEAHTWDSLGYIHDQLGDHGHAADCYSRAIALCAECGDRYGEAESLTHLGDALQAGGDPDAARTAWRRALDILIEVGSQDADAVRARLPTEV